MVNSAIGATCILLARLLSNPEGGPLDRSRYIYLSICLHRLITFSVNDTIAALGSALAEVISTQCRIRRWTIRRSSGSSTPTSAPWKVGSRRPPPSRACASSRETKELTDTYYDTEDWRFYRAGYALRVRRDGKRVEATMKSLAPPEDGGLKRRREISEPLRSDGPKP